MIIIGAIVSVIIMMTVVTFQEQAEGERFTFCDGLYLASATESFNERKCPLDSNFIKEWRKQ